MPLPERAVLKVESVDGGPWQGRGFEHRCRKRGSFGVTRALLKCTTPSRSRAEGDGTRDEEKRSTGPVAPVSISEDALAPLQLATWIIANAARHKFTSREAHIC